MNILEIIILGIIQGITEFLPISSSGHLVIAQNILGIKSPGNTLEVLFHFGTLMSVVYVFFEDLKQILLTMNEKNNQSFIFYIIIATLPAVFSGLLLKDAFLLLDQIASMIVSSFSITKQNRFFSRINFLVLPPVRDSTKCLKQ